MEVQAADESGSGGVLWGESMNGSEELVGGDDADELEGTLDEVGSEVVVSEVLALDDSGTSFVLREDALFLEFAFSFVSSSSSSDSEMTSGLSCLNPMIYFFNRCLSLRADRIIFTNRPLYFSTFR